MKTFTFSNSKKHLVFVMFLLFFTLGAFAQSGVHDRSGEAKSFEVMVKYYPDHTYANSPYVRVVWGDNLNPNFVDFEDETIPGAWDNDNNYPWVVTTPKTISGYNGSYCMMSGNGGVANSTSSIQVTYDFGETGGNISFIAGCYGETYFGSDYDVCQFFIDDEELFSFGASQSWDAYSYGVPSGTHTFKWSYTKDYDTDSSVDGFFVDDVYFMVGVKGRAADQYNLYRKQMYMPAAVDPDTVAVGVSGTEYIDEEWLTLTNGIYQYGVEIVDGTGAGIFWSDNVTKNDVDEFHIAFAADPDTAGTVTGGGDFYYGEQCTLIATANTGYQFYSWMSPADSMELGVPYNPEYTFTVTNSDSIVGYFLPLRFYPLIIVDPNDDAGSADFPDEGYYEFVQFGDQPTLVATPNVNLGYKFVKWTCRMYNQSFDLSTNDTCTFTVDEDSLNHFDFNNFISFKCYYISCFHFKSTTG